MSTIIKRGKTQAQRERAEKAALQAQVVALQQTVGSLMLANVAAATADATGGNA